MASYGTSKVYRATNLPYNVDRLVATELLARCLRDISPGDIILDSLASAVDPWARSTTKVATLRFKSAPVVITQDPDQTEWSFPEPGYSPPVTLDSHFYGLTPLNEVSESSHTDDCIVISGLASHPLGSWQPRGEKSFMWIRDALPDRFPGIRFITYGYNTTLSHSKSFQVIPDLAGSFISELKAGGWTAPSAKPLLFLAHSLGGVVLKQSIAMLAGSGERERQILRIIKGAIFFGVPTEGMKLSDTYEMLGTQPNTALLDYLSDQSDYLPDLEKQFDGLSYTRDMVLFWAYETQQTPSLCRSSGGWKRSGPGTVMVSPQSATGGRYGICPESLLQIDADHSNMVKFRVSDRLIPILVDKVREIIGNTMIYGFIKTLGQGPSETTATQPNGLCGEVATQDMTEKALRRLIDNKSWFCEVVKDSLLFPERDLRLHHIDKNTENTFSWVFDHPDINLSSWLLKGEGIFWISGKPGSGKSTMMKFIWNDPRTAELLHRWGSKRDSIFTNFFFHHRGSVIQKSFEGLLQSIIYQILDKEPQLCTLLENIVEATFSQAVTKWRESDDLTQLKLPARSWTKRALERSLQNILLQDVMDIDLFLLLDALDEYDGRPEFIADFLKQMTDSTSRTRVRVLFSSRPWKVFQEEFASCPGFRIHEHTEDDIRKYSVISVPPKAPGAELLLGITEEVVRRSQGVFLWVKLVMHELSLVLDESLQENLDKQELSLRLEQKLKQLPDQLDKFYYTIVERIPDVFRWDTYVLLECLVRSHDNLEVGKALSLLALSQAATLKEVKRVFDIRFGLRPRSMRKDIRQLKAISGGLVEISEIEDRGFYGLVGLDDESSTWVQVQEVQDPLPHLQFMHQTVREFVQDPGFRHAVLGVRGEMTNENGHSFLAKYSFYQLILRRDFLNTDSKRLANETDKAKWRRENTSMQALFFHAREAEKTTGTSQSFLLDRAVIHHEWSPLKISVAAGLRLLLREILHDDPDAILNCRGGLLPAILFAQRRKYCEPADAIQMVVFIVEHGYETQQDSDSIHELFETIWKNRTSDNASIKSILDFKMEEDYKLDTCISLAREALKGYEGKRAPSPTGRVGHSMSRLLHGCPPELIRQLLALGANPNKEDQKRNTALDSFIVSISVNSRFWIDTAIHDALTALIESRAVLQTTPDWRWELLTREFAVRDYDTKSFSEITAPKNLTSSKSFEQTNAVGRVTGSAQIMEPAQIQRSVLVGRAGPTARDNKGLEETDVSNTHAHHQEQTLSEEEDVLAERSQERRQGSLINRAAQTLWQRWSHSWRSSRNVSGGPYQSD